MFTKKIWSFIYYRLFILTFSYYLVLFFNLACEVNSAKALNNFGRSSPYFWLYWFYFSLSCLKGILEMTLRSPKPKRVSWKHNVIRQWSNCLFTKTWFCCFKTCYWFVLLVNISILLGQIVQFRRTTKLIINVLACYNGEKLCWWQTSASSGVHRFIKISPKILLVSRDLSLKRFTSL